MVAEEEEEEEEGIDCVFNSFDTSVAWTGSSSCASLPARSRGPGLLGVPDPGRLRHNYRPMQSTAQEFSHCLRWRAA